MDESSSMPWKDRLRQERIRRNWRQQDLADQVGTTVATIKRWERGSQQPSAYFRVKLCALLGQSAEELGFVIVTPHSPSPSLPSITQEDIPATEQAKPLPTEPPELWTMPYPRNPHFTGRENLLDQLTWHFSAPRQNDLKRTCLAALTQPQAIKGLGGIGKTQVAVEYAYRAREQGRYTHTFWINAASQEAVITSFQTLAERLPNFAARDEKDQQKLIAAVLHWLQECPQPWLLIFDNADDLSLVQHSIPQQGPGSILLTTRATAVGWLANGIEVEQMGLIEGTWFLLHRTQCLQTSDEERNEASNVVIALDGFPLALDQAGAYIEETGCGFRDYLHLYEQHRTQLLARRGKQATNYPDSVATTWSLSFQKVEQVHPAAAELLRLCAYLSPDHIPEELITEGAAYWSPVLQQAVADQFTFNELLEALLSFSLVKRLTQEHLLSLHRLVQIVQLDRMAPQEQHSWAERVVCAVNTLFPADPKDEIAAWPLCLRYLEQVQACDALIQQYSLQLPEAANLLDRAGIYLRDHASYSLAESLFQRALAIAEQQLGPKHLQVGTSLNNLGNLYREQGQYEQAEPLYQRALLLEQALGPYHPLVVTSLNNLGHLYCEQGKYEQAEPLYQRALLIREQALGLHHPEVASSLNGLGGLYREQGKHEQAEPLYQRALLIREQALGLYHPLVATSLNNLSNLYCEQSKYEQAEPLYQRALLIWEQALGLHHPEVAYPLNNLGLLYCEQGKYEQAEPLLQRALLIREQALGLYHPLVASSLNGLGNLSREQGQYEQAEVLYQRALSVRRQSLGPQHIRVAESLQDLAQLRQMQQHNAEALSLYQQALAIQEQVLGTHHPRTNETRERLCSLAQIPDRKQEATSLKMNSLPPTNQSNK